MTRLLNKAISLHFVYPPIQSLDTSFTYHDHPLNTNHTWGTVSIPRDHAYNPTDRQPNEGLEVTKRFMQYILPEFGDAEIESSK
jgi:sarcosine oxidase / L-pipecolate oxidase